MAFQKECFNPIGGQSKPVIFVAGSPARGGPMMWSYITEDAPAVVDTAGYFNGVFDLLRIGDLIYAVTTAAGAVTNCGWYVVRSKDSATRVVDVTDTTVVAVTNTD